MNAAVHTYEKPHGGTEGRGHEAVQRADGVDVDGVVWERRVLGRAHSRESALHGEKEPTG
jgi:hypothetical protein